MRSVVDSTDLIRAEASEIVYSSGTQRRMTDSRVLQGTKKPGCRQPHEHIRRREEMKTRCLCQIHEVKMEMISRCTHHSSQKKQDDHLIFNTQPADIHNQRIPQKKQHHHPQLPTPKIDNRWKPTSKESYTEHNLLQLQLLKTMQQSVSLPPRCKLFSNLEATASD